jgi:hypothetical protein
MKNLGHRGQDVSDGKKDHLHGKVEAAYGKKETLHGKGEFT